MFIETVDAEWVWLAVGAVLTILELATGSLFLIWVSLAAFAVAMLTFLIPDLGVHWQLILFAVIGVSTTYLGRTYFKGRVGAEASDRPMLNRRDQQLVGRNVTAVSDFANGEGRVQLGDSPWSARLDASAGNIAVATGESLTVVSVEGVTLIVAPV